jgi:hypothetical protein
MIMEISTPEDWWALVDEHWEDLVRILVRFIPEEVKSAEEAKNNRDWETLHTHFEDAWFNAPDKPWTSLRRLILIV